MWIDAIVCVFLIAQFCSSIYQIALLVLCWKYWRDVWRPQPAVPVFEAGGDRPFVTIQLPMFNEAAVAGRLMEAVAAFDYPLDRMEVQVVDDSTDDSPRILQAKIDELQARQPGLMMTLVRRADREGFKAGALKAAMPAARGEFVAIFDADFAPKPDFLQKTIPHFIADPKVAVVQSRWGHLNAGDSIITRFQEFFLDGHHSVEQRGRCAAGYFLTFNGTAGVWRRAAMDHAGGWNTDTLVEDIDLSFRTQLLGWKIKFLENYATPGELPNSILAFRVQLFRWMKGGAQVGKKVTLKVLRSNMPLAVKFHACCQMYVAISIAGSLLVVLLSGILPILLAYSPESSRLMMLGVAGYLWLPFIVLVFGTPRLRFDEGPLWKRLLLFIPRVLVFMAVMAGLAGQGTVAIFQALFAGRGEWVVTPKGFTTPAAAGGGAENKPKRTQKRLPWYVWLDIPIALYIAASIGVSAWYHNYAPILFMCVWLAGYLFLFLGSWLETRPRKNATSQSQPQPQPLTRLTLAPEEATAGS